MRVGDAAASVVADDREALEPEPRHELDELGGHLALAVALTQRTPRRGAALSVALQVTDHDGVPLGEQRGHAMPAVVGLGESVQEQHRSARAGDSRRVAGRPDRDGRVVETGDAEVDRARHEGQR
jgi:hypothetical protein